MDSFREYTLQLGAVFQEWRTFPRALRDDASRVAVGTFTLGRFSTFRFSFHVIQHFQCARAGRRTRSCLLLLLLLLP